jgi:Uma2 family endonuclease
MVALSQEQHPIRMTEAEYLEFERASETKHEFYNGEVFAMAGATYEHNMIFAGTFGSLHAQLRGKSCRVIPSDQRIRIKTGLYTYPDISVVCGETQFAPNAFDTIVNPTVLIEILSKSSEAYDRGDKFQHYREIDTLQTYILISQTKPYIESYTKGADGKWTLTDAVGLEAILEIPSIDCTLALADVYENVTFTKPDDVQADLSDNQ